MKKLCKGLMKAFPSYPSSEDPHLWEVFKTDTYLNGSVEIKKKMRYSSALASYEYEQNLQDSWLVRYFFPRIDPRELEDKVILDLGCFTGGRLVAWTESYKLRQGLGIDINAIFKLAGDEFAESRGIKNTQFDIGVGESLPYDDDSIDFVVATDVFEHVADLEQVLNECRRVLKGGESCFVSFLNFCNPWKLTWVW